jgi:hypothetical protein
MEGPCPKPDKNKMDRSALMVNDFLTTFDLGHKSIPVLSLKPAHCGKRA